MLGDYNCHVAEHSEQTIDVEHVYTHNHYQRHSHANDIALIKLAHEVNTTVNDVTPACLPTNAEQKFGPGDGCYVTGWGETEGEGSFQHTKLINFFLLHL